MKKYLKTIISSLMVILFIVSVQTTCLAQSEFSPNQVKPGEGTTQTGSIYSLGNNVAKILVTLGSVVSVIVLIILGIKYMVGSPEDKSEYKKSMMPYVIGAVIVFAATTIATVIFNFASGISVE